MRFCVLGSGSKGNATYVEAEDGSSLLIDAGFSGVEIERRLAAISVDSSRIQAIILTHEHGDHIRGAGVLSRRLHIPVYSNHATHQAANLKKLHEHVTFHNGKSFAIGELQCHPFTISHDAVDPVGFVIKNKGRSLGYCTDTGVVSRLIQYRLSQCSTMILECNHDPDMLRNGPYSPSLQQRVRSNIGHLANRQALAFLNELLHADLHHVVLAHISETNNHPDVITREIIAMWDEGEKLPAISLACQDMVGEVIRV